MGDLPNKRDVERANIEFYTATAQTYDTDQPHFRPENKERVSAVLRRLAREAGSELLVDFGCGTGFIISLALPYFHSIVGVDITPAMVDKVPRGAGTVKVIVGNTESVPMDDGTADVITSNSFLHHLRDIRPTVSEAYRLLKTGGIFYSEQDPNICFFNSIKALSLSEEALRTYSDVVKRELYIVRETRRQALQVEATTGVNANQVQMAEYHETYFGGMNGEDVKGVFRDAGFSSVKLEYYWFLGQGPVMHRSPELADQVEACLRSVLPLSKSLFKYFRIEARK